MFQPQKVPPLTVFQRNLSLHCWASVRFNSTVHNVRLQLADSPQLQRQVTESGFCSSLTTGNWIARTLTKPALSPKWGKPTPDVWRYQQIPDYRMHGEFAFPAERDRSRSEAARRAALLRKKFRDSFCRTKLQGRVGDCILNASGFRWCLFIYEWLQHCFVLLPFGACRCHSQA